MNDTPDPAAPYRVLAGRRWTFRNLAGHVTGKQGVKALVEWVRHQFDPALNWREVEWIRSVWPGKLIIKGILDVEDARIASKTGASAMVARRNCIVRILDTSVVALANCPVTPCRPPAHAENADDTGGAAASSAPKTGD